MLLSHTWGLNTNGDCVTGDRGHVDCVFVCVRLQELLNFVHSTTDCVVLKIFLRFDNRVWFSHRFTQGVHVQRIPGCFDVLASLSVLFF